MCRAVPRLGWPITNALAVTLTVAVCLLAAPKLALGTAACGLPAVESNASVLQLCPGPEGTAVVLGSLNVEGQVQANLPSPREISFQADLDAATGNMHTLRTEVVANLTTFKMEMELGVTAPGNRSYTGTVASCDPAALSVLEGVSYLDGSIMIQNCDSLTTLGSLFHSLQEATGSIRIQNCAKLTSLENAFPRLTALGDQIYLSDNPVLITLGGTFSNLVTSGINIYQNPALRSFGDGSFSSLVTAGNGFIVIKQNPNLFYFGKDCFSKVVNVKIDLEISSNGLFSLGNAFENLERTEWGRFYLASNPNLISLGTAFQNLVSIAASPGTDSTRHRFMYITENPSLLSLEGAFPKLEAIEGELGVMNNAELKSLTGSFPRLNAVNGPFVHVCGNHDGLTYIPPTITSAAQLVASNQYTCTYTGSQTCCS